MKILYLLSQCADFTGSGIYTRAIIQQASTNGHQTALLFAVNSNDKTPDLPHCQHSTIIHFGNDLPFPVVGMSNVMPYNSSRWDSLSSKDFTKYKEVFLNKMDEIIGAFKPDLIHANHLWVLSALASENHKHIPLVISCHGSDLRQFRSLPKVAGFVKNGLKQVSAVFALSESQKDEITHLYETPSNKIFVTGNGFDPNIFNDHGRDTQHSIPHLLYAGKLASAKGVPQLLKACSILKDKGIDFKLTLCGQGTGEDKDLCDKLANKLSDCVEFTGNIPQKDLANYMRKSDIFILPSMFEGVPLSLIEAMACGCLLIATNLPGVLQLLQSAPEDIYKLLTLPPLENVDQLPVQYEDDFCKKLATLIEVQISILKTSSQKQIAHYRKQFSNKFSWDGVFSNISNIYSNVIDRKYQ